MKTSNIYDQFSNTNSLSAKFLAEYLIYKFISCKIATKLLSEFSNYIDIIVLWLYDEKLQEHAVVRRLLNNHIFKQELLNQQFIQQKIYFEIFLTTHTYTHTREKRRERRKKEEAGERKISEMKLINNGLT